MERDIVQITDDRDGFDSQKLANLLENVGFGSSEAYMKMGSFKDKFFPDHVGGMFAIHIGARELIGMVRIFSDGHLVSWISEICVKSEFQNRGIGSRLLHATIESYGHTSIYVEALNGRTQIFHKFGISPKRRLTACSRAGIHGQRNSQSSLQ